MRHFFRGGGGSEGIEDNYFLKQRILFAVSDSRFLGVDSLMGIGEVLF